MESFYWQLGLVVVQVIFNVGFVATFAWVWRTDRAVLLLAQKVGALAEADDHQSKTLQRVFERLDQVAQDLSKLVGYMEAQKR